MKRTAPLQIGWDLFALALGFGIFYVEFISGFVGSSWMWAAIVARFICAFGMSWQSVSWFPTEHWAHRFIRFLLLECGALLIVLWGIFNFVEVHQVGFNLTLWVAPTVFDFLSWQIAARLSSARHRSLFKQALT